MGRPALQDDQLTDEEEVALEYSRREISLSRSLIVASVRWSWFAAIGYEPHRYQVAMHNSEARYRLSCAGRRGGKSYWAAMEAAAYMIAGPFRVWIVAPSYALGALEFEYVLAALEHPANPYKIKINNNPKAGNMSITLSNGASIDVISIDKPKLSGHGQEVDLIILSEAGLADNLGGELGVWNKTLMGAMATRRADVIVPTTPQGQDDFLYPMFMKGLVPDSEYSKYQLRANEFIDLIKYYKCEGVYDEDYFSLQWPTWANVDGYLEDVRKQFNTLPLRIFLEQLGGFFVSWSGSIWLNDFCYDPNIHFIQPHSVPQWWRRIEIIDPGFSGLFAWIAAVIDGDGNIFVVDEYSAKRTLYGDHVKEIKRRRIEFAASNGYAYDDGIDGETFIPVYVDPEDPQCRAELAKLGLRCAKANNDIIAGFQSGAQRFKAETLHIFNTCPKFDNALRNHEWAKTKTEGGKAKEANDAHKHFSDLARYLNLAAVWPAEEPVRELPDDGSYSERGSELMAAMMQADVNYRDMSPGDWRVRHE